MMKDEGQKLEGALSTLHANALYANALSIIK